MPLSLRIPRFNAPSVATMISPLYLLGPPLLLVVSVPLAFFAVVTTTIAISTLAVRVSIVYFELAVALIHSYLFPPPQKSAPIRPSQRRNSPQRTRRRRSSLASTASSQDTAVPHQQRLHHKSGSFASLLGSGELTRDFEGVGGWRMPGDEEEEALWMGMNSRLELPAALPKRRHQRSLTSGSQRYSWSPEAMRMSPMQSRARTPVPGERHGQDDYFPAQPRPFSTASDPSGATTRDGRRKSSSGCSSSSSGSGSGSRRTSVATKQPGE